MDFNRAKDDYRDTIERSIAFAGKGLDFFTEVKADYLYQIVFRLLKDVTVPKILDIGCGHGLMHPYLRSFGFEIVGTDVANEVLSLARAANPEVAYVGYDGLTLPFTHKSFDLALAVCVMHHVPAGPVERVLAGDAACSAARGPCRDFRAQPAQPPDPLRGCQQFDRRGR